MENMIHKITEILNNCKGFNVGWDGDSLNKGYFYIRYEGKPYAIKVIEMDDAVITDRDRQHYANSSDETIKDFKNIKNLEYWD